MCRAEIFLCYECDDATNAMVEQMIAPIHLSG